MARRFERQLDKATESTLIEPNWDAIIECVDLIRGGEAPVKAAVSAIRKRYHNDNPHVAHHALLVLEACMKNCGAKFHAEVATKDFMEDLKNLSLDGTPDKVKNKILELLQCWAIAFKDKPEYKIVVDTHNLMKLAGFEFPKVAEADAMFIAESAPEWADGEECFRCRTGFGILTRKHHCRACGQIFCDKCSSKQSYLPQYGIEKPVRVCDGCYEKSPSGKSKSSGITESPSSFLSGNLPPTKSEKSLPVDAKKTAEQRARELKQAEEDEINLALAISQSEAEAQERERQRRLYQLYNGTDSTATANGFSTSSVPPENSVYKGAALKNGNEVSASTAREPPVDPELARYLNRDYWQQRKTEQRNAADYAVVGGYERHKTPTPTAPPPSESSNSRGMRNNDNLNDSVCSLGGISLASTQKQLEGVITPTPQFSCAEDEQTAETMEFCKQLREQVTVMDNRIRSNVARSRSIVNDTAIQSLFIRLTEMHAQVMARMNKLEDQRNYFESLQDHLAHIQEARQAVNALREDHERRKQEKALEEQRMRQQQMQQKVDLMRQKKHESLLHQRHLALLRFQQQEQEMQMRRMQTQHVNVLPSNSGYYVVASQPGMAITYTHPPAVGQNSLVAQQPEAVYYPTVAPYVQPHYEYGGTQYAEQTQQPNLMNMSLPQQTVAQQQLSTQFTAPQQGHGSQDPNVAKEQAVASLPNSSPLPQNFGVPAVPCSVSVQTAAQGLNLQAGQTFVSSQQFPYISSSQAVQAPYLSNCQTVQTALQQQQASMNPSGDASNTTQQQFLQHMTQVPQQQMSIPQVQQQYSNPHVHYQQQQHYPSHQLPNQTGVHVAQTPGNTQEITGQTSYQPENSAPNGQHYQGLVPSTQYVVPAPTQTADISQPTHQPAEDLLISFD